MNRDKKICEALGICWHKWDRPVLHNQMYTCELCGIVSDYHWHPDFTSDAGKVRLLREMQKRLPVHKWIDFVEYLTGRESVIGSFLIINYLSGSDPGKLRDAAWEWLFEKVTKDES